VQRLLLVRHAAPLIDPPTPSSEWALSPQGEEAARRFAQSLAAPPATPIYSSAETKAVQTARLLSEGWGVQVRVEEDLHEVEGRPWANSPAEYEQIVGRYLRGEAVDGWEERTGAQRRIATAVQKLMGPDQDVLVVSHGLVLVRWLSWLLKVEPGTLFPVWRTIRFPDVCIVDWETREVVLPFGQPL
jgi:broad specificity phosphatase PhoE